MKKKTEFPIESDYSSGLGRLGIRPPKLVSGKKREKSTTKTPLFGERGKIVKKGTRGVARREL